MRPEPYSLQRETLLLVDSPEPIRLLTSLSSGPQSLVEDPVPAPLPPIPLVLIGPEGVGKSMLMARLLEDLPDKVGIPSRLSFSCVCNATAPKPSLQGGGAEAG